MLMTGCAAETRRLPGAPRLLAEVAAAPRRPVQLPDAEKRDVLQALEGSRAGAAKAFADPELSPEVWASFWRSPLTNQVDRDRLLLVRYYEDGTYVYVGFGRDGLLFTDGAGGLLMEPPWSQ